MGGRFEFEKTIPIDYKLVRKEDIRKLAQFIDGFYELCQHKANYTVTFDNKTTLSGTDLSIFDTDTFIKGKCVHIKIDYNAVDTDDRLLVMLYNSVKDCPESEIRVFSYSKAWYDNVVEKLEAIVDEMPPQKSIAGLDGAVGLAVVPLLGAVLYAILLVIILRSMFPGLSGSGALSFIMLAIAVVSFAAFYQFIRVIIQIYPKIEFAFGPDYDSRGVKIKETFAWGTGIVIMPLIFLIVDRCLK